MIQIDIKFVRERRLLSEAFCVLIKNKLVSITLELAGTEGLLGDRLDLFKRWRQELGTSGTETTAAEREDTSRSKYGDVITSRSRERFQTGC